MTQEKSQTNDSVSIKSGIYMLLALLGKKEKAKCVGIIGLALCSSFFEIITASVIVVFAQILSQPAKGEKYFHMIGGKGELSPNRVIFYVALVFGAVYLIKNIVATLEVFYQNFTIQRMNYDFQEKLLTRFAGLDYNFHLKRNASYGMAVVAADANHTFSSGMTAFAVAFSEGVVFLCLLGMVIYMNPSLALAILIAGAVISIFIIKVLLPFCYSWGKIAQEATVLGGQNLLQFFHAFKEIILLNKTKEFVNLYNKYSAKKTRSQAIQSAINLLPRIIIELLFVGFFVGVITFMCISGNPQETMIGILGGYLYLGFRLMPGLNRVIGQLSLFKASIPSMKRVYDEYTQEVHYVHYEDTPSFHFNEILEFKGVSFRYLNTTRDVIKNINLKINKGDCVGITGETGSGKSTLLDLILGLLRPTGGEILIDGKHPVSSRQWHKLIGYVPQSIYLIDDTIASNIAFGESKEGIDYSRLNKVIKEAQLNSLISKLPEGLETIVGERGVRLSGGERQRVAIARALYLNPEIIIFDEATSALDDETEERLMSTIYEVSKTKTVIMIAHRLTSLKNCGYIFSLSDGSISKLENSNKVYGNA